MKRATRKQVFYVREFLRLNSPRVEETWFREAVAAVLTERDEMAHSDACQRAEIRDLLDATLELAAENQRLRERVAQLEAEVPYLKHLSVEGGALDITIEGAKAVTRMMAESLAEMFRAEKAVNYVQYEVRSGEHDYILLLQLASGKTPHQLRQEAERERDEARADRDIYKHVLDAIADFLKTGAVDPFAEQKSTVFLAVRELRDERDAALAQVAVLREALADMEDACAQVASWSVERIEYSDAVRVAARAALAAYAEAKP